MAVRPVICFVVLLSLFSSITNVQGQLVNITQTAVGTAGGNLIWYQSDTNNFLSWGNVKNPVQVSIIYNSGSTVTNATICVNSFAKSFPISGVNLNSTCPYGGTGIVTNSTQIVLTPPTGSLEDSDNSTDTSGSITASVYVKPTTEGGFVVVIPENNVTQTFQLTLTAEQCTDPTQYPVGTGENICEDIPEISENTEKQVTITAGSWQYFRLTTSVLSNYTNAIYAYTNNSESIKVFTQSGYYPTESWNIPTVDAELSDNIGQSMILTPGIFNTGETFFFGLQNFGDSTETITFNITTSTCNSFTLFGNECGHSTGDNVNAASGVYVISATLSSPNATNATTNNVGSAFSFDYSDNKYKNEYAYFALDEYPNYSTPYYIRVSAANNDVTDSDGAPAIFAKKGGYPSAQSNHYNISTVGDVAHQFLIRIDDEDVKNQNESSETWYFAVQLPADFSVWVGSNCAGNCNNQAFGVCMCDSWSCENVTSGFGDPAAFYKRPRSIIDSGGACSCVDDDYDRSYNCSEVKYPNFWIWITMISLIAAFVLILAIGIPIVCCLTNQRKQSYEAVE